MQKCYNDPLMLSIAHGVVGAMVATKIPDPLVSVPMILGLHYLGDWIPHWDIGTGLSDGKRRRMTAFFFELADLVAMAGLLIWFWQWGSPQVIWPIYWGALAGILPDLLMAPRTFLKWEPRWLRPINDFHYALHLSTPHKIVGLAPQLLLVTLVYLLK